MRSVAAVLEQTGRKAALAAIAVLVAIEAAHAQQNAQQNAPQNAMSSSDASATRNVVILVSIPDRKLAVVEAGIVTHTYPIAVGKESSPSPAGDFTVVNRVVKPTYYHPGVVIPAGPQNPLGTRWIGLSKKGFGIHGTNEPRSIGKAASHGCIRMRRADLEQLFALLRSGDVVSIRAERDEQIASVFGGSAATTTAQAAAATQPASISASN